MAAPKGHPRYGGRTKGRPNKATLARAESIQAEVRARGQRPGLEVMRQVMNYFMGLAAKYQESNEDKSAKFAKIGGDFAAKITEYETPKLQSTTLRHDAPAEPIKIQVEMI